MSEETTLQQSSEDRPWQEHTEHEQRSLQLRHMLLQGGASAPQAAPEHAAARAGSSGDSSALPEAVWSEHEREKAFLLSLL